MFQTNKFSSFMISDILKCDNHEEEGEQTPDQMSSMVCNSLKSYTNYTNSQINNYFNLSEDNNSGAYEGPSVDTILWQHYLLRQRVLMQSKPRKGGQIRFTSEQSVTLEKQFVRQKYLSPPERKSIANELGLTERQIKTWFQNRRAKWRRCKQFNDVFDRESDKHILFDKYKDYKDMHSCSRDNDNNQPLDGYQCHNSDIGLNFRLIDFT